MASGISASVATADFLQLLTIQLQNQDPINPVQQEDFISQLSQFSQLENTEELNTSFKSMLKLQEISQGLDLVGKQISYLNTDTDKIEKGKVDEFFVENGNINLSVNGRTISVDLVSGVRAED